MNWRKITLFNSLILVFLRCYEFFVIHSNYPEQENLIFQESIGLLNDFILETSIIIACSFIFSFKLKLIKIIFLSLYFLFIISKLLITEYFFYQLYPLDVFVYKYSLSEILFTVKTSGINVAQKLAQLTLILAMFFLLFYVIIKKFNSKIKFSKRSKFLSLIILILLFFFTQSKTNLSLNKAHYFYKKSIAYLFKSNELLPFNTELSKAFNELFLERKDFNPKYPLERKSTKQKFESFTENKIDKVVLIIVEGLNDDFIHPYRNLNLMPFLSSLKDSSYYWEKCFTLGERSFAALPCLTGGLLYGQDGFTIQEKFPLHQTLFSLLEAEGKKTAFFYGQGAWFHNKNSFLGFNQCQNIYDNATFSDNYKKIIVGKDKFFWGYDDKALFSNYFDKQNDSLQSSLDVFFTGTMHAPFIFEKQKQYEKKLLKESKNDPLIKTKIKNFSSIHFTDDALKEFIQKYAKRSDYKNTLFVITGDHPMTELPRKNELKKYHVPLLLYQDGMQAKKFKHIISHLDIYETLWSILATKDNYTSTSIGKNIFNSSPRKLVFMDDNRETNSYLSNNVFLQNTTLYTFNAQLELNQLNNSSLQKQLLQELIVFNSMNEQLVKYNKILSWKNYAKNHNYRILNMNWKNKANYSSSEFIDLFSQAKMHYQKLFLSFDYYTKTVNKSACVISISDSSNKEVFNKTIYLDPAKTNFQQFIAIPFTVKKSYKTHIYFWNPDKKNIDLKDVELKFLNR